MSRFQLEKLRTACLNKNIHARRLSPKWPTEKAEKRVFQTFQRVEGKMFVSFFFNDSRGSSSHVCMCGCPSTLCSAADGCRGYQFKGRTQGSPRLATLEPQQMLSSPRCQRCCVTRGDQMEDYLLCLL